MKVLFISHAAALAGAERSLANLVIQSNSHPGIHSLILTVPRAGPLQERVLEQGIDVRVIRTHQWMGRRHAGWRGVVRLVQCVLDLGPFIKLLWIERPDKVVVNTTVIPAPLLASFLMRIPAVVISRESILSNPSLRSSIPKSAIQYALRTWSHHIVAVSNYVASQLDAPATVIYNEILVPESRGLAVAPGPLNVAMFGTLSPEKGQQDAIEAVAICRGKGRMLRLDIYGDGDRAFRDSLTGRIGRHGLAGYVQLHAPVPSIFDVLGKYDVTLCCSRNEAFGRATVESILYGVPVVGYDVGGTAELMAHGGGRPVSADVFALADALCELVDDRSAVYMLAEACKRSSLHSVLTGATDRMIEDILRG